MSRRSTTERVLYTVNPSISSGNVELVAPDENTILAPKSIVVCASSGTDFEYDLVTNGDVFLHGNVPASTCDTVEFPNGLELPLGSGIEIVRLAGEGTTTLYYVPHDSTPGITKSAARAASYVPSATATRTPNQFGGQSLT